MKPLLRKGTFTFDEFCTLVRDGQKGDLIDGRIYVASPDNLSANKLNAWLLRLIGDYVEEKGLGEVYLSRAAFRLGEQNSPEPDIAFVRKERLGLEQTGYFNGPPDLAVEIVSPESVTRDYEEKRGQYQAAGVAEYWIIDEEERKVLLLRLGRDRRYREVKARKGELRSRALPGFWLRPEWLWQSPRPRKNVVLAEILARPG
jgi:Uma2 family endonuclease